MSVLLAWSLVLILNRGANDYTTSNFEFRNTKIDIDIDTGIGIHTNVNICRTTDAKTNTNAAISMNVSTNAIFIGRTSIIGHTDTNTHSHIAISTLIPQKKIIKYCCECKC